MKGYSLTRRLIVAVLLVQLCSSMAFLSLAAVFEAFSHFHAFDVMLHGRADSMVGAVQDAEDKQDNLMLDGTQILAPKSDIFVVRDDSGRMLGHSPNWAEAENVTVGGSEFRTMRVNARQYRVIRVAGLRMVDPGDAGGGVARHVTVLYGSPTWPVWERIGHGVAFYSGVTVLLLGGTALVLFSLLKRGLAPLHEIARQAGQVSVRSWRFSPSSTAREVRELEPLVSALEAALGGLERSFAQQSQFVSDAAHELKTSVAVVKSSLQVLMMRTRTPAEYGAGLERLQVDCARLEELVGNMLTLAGLEASEQTREMVQVELGGVARDVAEQFRTLAEVGKMEIHVAAAEPVWVKGEREQLRLLCSNLMHNALQHSLRAGEVNVAVTRRGGAAELRVEDCGEGISAATLPFVFDRFYRADPSRSRLTGGTGLGLTISKAIVVRLGGEIRLESEEGQGTCAVVTFPEVK